MLSALKWVMLGILFALLATANGAGYRYGGSDQAFYIPAVVNALDPLTFPRDASLIDAQAGLILVDEAIASAARLTGLSIEVLFLVGYLASLAITWAGVVFIGQHLYSSIWGTAALGAAFTLRHRISQTSANSFEPYFHPRMLAFAIGLLAVAAFLRRRPWLAIALVGASAVAHATTAIWFALLLGAAIAIADRPLRRVVVGGALVTAIFLIWAAIGGPLRASWTVMDDAWLQAVASKDSLFPDGWPLWAWIANLGLLPLLAWAQWSRKTRGRDSALVWGAAVLVALFLITLPFVLARLAFFVEFQISRVFWPLDFLATAFLIAAISSWRSRAAVVLAALLLAISLGRGVFIMYVENPERALFAMRLPASAWHDAMAWIGQQPTDVHVLTDPGHAWKHGTSVRVSARRDVFLEEVKDSAVAIYSRAVAARVVERTHALGDFAQLTAEKARELGRQYDLDLLVTPEDMPLPLLYVNREFRIYSLAPRPLNPVNPAQASE